MTRRPRRPDALAGLVALVLLTMCASCYTVQRKDVAQNAGRPGEPTTTSTQGTSATPPPAGTPSTSAGGPIPGTDFIVPPEPAAAGLFKFLETNADGSPIGYPACTEIHYVIHLGRGPAGGQSLIQQALTRMREVSGLHFVFDGFTDRIPQEGDRIDVDAPVWIGWAGRHESDSWNVMKSTVVGFAGSSWAQSPPGPAFYRTGRLMLDPDQAQLPQFGPGQTWGKILLHELAHLVGLDHVDDDKELMHPVETLDYPSDYGPGDLRGLWELGTSRGCLAPGTADRSATRAATRN